MERTKFKVVNSPLVGLYFISKGADFGCIKSMIKDNYWYLIDYGNNIQEVCNLSDMREWKFYNDGKTFQIDVDKYCK